MHAAAGATVAVYPNRSPRMHPSVSPPACGTLFRIGAAGAHPVRPLLLRRAAAFLLALVAAASGANAGSSPVQAELVSASVTVGKTLVASQGPAMVVVGRGGNITDGDTAPTAEKFTDFGGVPAGTGLKSRDFYIVNNGSAPLNLNWREPVTLSNTTDFMLIALPPFSVVDANGSAGMFTVRFKPWSGGRKTTTVTIPSDDPNHNPFTFTLAGTAVTPPVLGQPAIGDIFNQGATLSAAVTDLGGGPLTRAGVVYAPTAVSARPALGDGVSSVLDQDATSFSTGSFALSVRGLTPGTSYSFRAFAQNGATGNDASYTAVATFSSSLQQPDVSTVTAGDVTETGATLGATVDSDHGAAVTERGIRYGTTPFLHANDPGVVTVTAPGTAGAFTVPITGLAQNTRYYFAAYALNSFGAGLTALGSFTTLATAQEIEISGNATVIANEDTTPSTADGTDFGATRLFNGLAPWGIVHTFTITNTGGASLNLTGTPKVTISGMNAADFTIATTIVQVTPLPGGNELVVRKFDYPVSPVVARGGTTTFGILFQPSAAGLRSATVTVENDDPDESSYSFAVQGYGATTPGVAVGLAYLQWNQLVHFDPAGDSTATEELPITGVAEGERIVALDTRPATGALLAFGVDSEKNQGTLYTLDPAIGLVHPIGRPGSVAFFDAQHNAMALPEFPRTHYDMTVDPVADQVRVVTSSPLQFRIDPTTGLSIDGNYGSPGSFGGVNPDAPFDRAGDALRCAAYTDTALYLLYPTYTRPDIRYGEFTRVGSPSSTRSLHQNGVSFDGFRLLLGFDIPANVRAAGSHTAATAGYGYVLAATQDVDSEIMRVNLGTGEITHAKRLGQMVSGLALLSTPFEPAMLGTPTLRNVTEQLATIGGEVITDAGTGYIDAGVLISKTSDDADPKLGDPNVTVRHVSSRVGPFSSQVEGLLPETTYSYRLFALNTPTGFETTYSAVGTFTTTKAPELLGEADFVISTGREQRIYPLHNDSSSGAHLYLIDVNDPFISHGSESLLIPQGYTGTFTYYFSDGAKFGQGSVYVSSARPATVYSGLLRDRDRAIMGSVDVAFSPSMHAATVLLKVRTSVARLLVHFPPNSPTGFRETAFGRLSVATNEDGQIHIDLIPTPDDGRLVSILQPRHAPGARTRCNVALVSTDPARSGGGFGFLILRPDAGAVMMAVLPDGSVFTTSSSLRQDKTIPIFSSAGRGVAGGDLVLADLAASDLTGSWMWRKPPPRPGVQGLYLGGIDTLLDVTGCRYAGEFHMDGGGTLGIDGGDLAPFVEQGDNVSVTSGRPNLHVGILESWIAYRRQGIFLAGLKIPGRGSVRGRGVYLPKSQTAWGLFSGTTVGGRIVLSVP